MRKQAKGVIPKCIDLDRFTAPRCDNPIFHFRIHPGERVTVLTLCKQTVVWINVNIKLRSTQVVLDDFNQDWQQKFKRNAIVCLLEIAIERVEEPERRVGGIISPFFLLIRKHVWNQTVPDVMRERPKNVTSLKAAARS